MIIILNDIFYRLSEKETFIFEIQMQMKKTKNVLFYQNVYDKTYFPLFDVHLNKPLIQNNLKILKLNWKNYRDLVHNLSKIYKTCADISLEIFRFKPILVR